MDLSDLKVNYISNLGCIQPNIPFLTLTGKLIKLQLIETGLLNLLNYPILITTLANEIKLKFFKSQIIECGSQYAQSHLSGLIGIKCSYDVNCINYTNNIEASNLFKIPLWKDICLYEEENFNVELSKQMFLDILSEYFPNFNNDKANKLTNFLSSKLLNELNLNQVLNQFSSSVVSLSPYVERMDRHISHFVFYNFVLLILMHENGNSLEFDLNKIKPILIFNIEKELEENVIEIVKSLKEDLLELSNDYYLKSNNVELESIKSYLKSENPFKIGLTFNINHLKYEILKEDMFDFVFLDSNFIVSESQPALGCVYKMSEMNKIPTMKFSEEISKTTIPGLKDIIRLFCQDKNGMNNKIIDLLCIQNESEVEKILKNSNQSIDI